MIRKHKANHLTLSTHEQYLSISRHLLSYLVPAVFVGVNCLSTRFETWKDFFHLVLSR